MMRGHTLLYNKGRWGKMGEDGGRWEGRDTVAAYTTDADARGEGRGGEGRRGGEGLMGGEGETRMGGGRLGGNGNAMGKRWEARESDGKALESAVVAGVERATGEGENDRLETKKCGGGNFCCRILACEWDFIGNFADWCENTGRVLFSALA